MRRALTIIALSALALPGRAAAQAPDDRPFGRGVILPSVALGGSFAGRYGGSLLIGAGASYFVANGLAVGLHLRNVSTFYSRSFKEEYAAFIKQIPTNEFSILPSLQWVFYRSRYFSPYLWGGVGPVFLNHKGGVLGQWSAGPGFLIGTGGPMYIDLGLHFGMRFPAGRCREAYTFEAGGASLTNEYACSFMWGFRGGIVFGLGGRRQQRQAPPPAPPPTYSAPQSYPPPQSYPAPAAPPAATQPPTQPVPSDSPPPASPPAATTPPAATPGENPPTSAPPPATPPATTTQPPAGENVPVPPPG